VVVVALGPALLIWLRGEDLAGVALFRTRDEVVRAVSTCVLALTNLSGGVVLTS